MSHRFYRQKYHCSDISRVNSELESLGDILRVVIPGVSLPQHLSPPLLTLSQSSVILRQRVYSRGNDPRPTQTPYKEAA